MPLYHVLTERDEFNDAISQFLIVPHEADDIGAAAIQASDHTPTGHRIVGLHADGVPLDAWSALLAPHYDSDTPEPEPEPSICEARSYKITITPRDNDFELTVHRYAILLYRGSGFTNVADCERTALGVVSDHKIAQAATRTEISYYL